MVIMAYGFNFSPSFHYVSSAFPASIFQWTVVAQISTLKCMQSIVQASYREQCRLVSKISGSSILNQLPFQLNGFEV